jgi:hypothetical protein
MYLLKLDKDGTLHSNTGYSDQSCSVSALMRSVAGESLSTDENENTRRNIMCFKFVTLTGFRL